MNLGDPVRVLPSEYKHAGQAGVVVAYHGVLDGYVFVRFRTQRAELIEREFLQLIKGEISCGK